MALIAVVYIASNAVTHNASKLIIFSASGDGINASRTNGVASPHVINGTSLFMVAGVYLPIDDNAPWVAQIYNGASGCLYDIKHDPKMLFQRNLGTPTTPFVLGTP